MANQELVGVGTQRRFDMMPVVIISLGRFDATNYDTVRKLLDDNQKTLIPAIRSLKGNRAYYLGIDLLRTVQ